MINPTSAVPLYVQVADDLRRRIEMGEFFRKWRVA